MPVTGRAWASAADDAAAHAFVDELGDTVTIAGSDGHHLQRVRRLQPGETITLSDGSGCWRRYTVISAPRGSLVAEARGDTEREPDLTPRIVIALALTKGGLDSVAARLTEIGVHRIEPLVTKRTVAKWDPARARRATARLRVVVREAAAQCRRARIPEIGELLDIATLTGRPDVVLADRDGLVAAQLPAPRTGEWTIAVGPEGGFAPEEREHFDGPRLAIGPYVLRAETAPIAACAALRGRAPWSEAE